MPTAAPRSSSLVFSTTSARPCRRPRSATGLAKKSKIDRSWRLPGVSEANSRRWVTDLRWPGSSRGVVELRREIAEIDLRHRRLEMAELAELLGRHRDLVRPAPAEHVDGRGSRVAERAEGMGDDVRADELGRRLGEDAGDVERDIAVADHHRGCRRRAAARGRRIRDGRYTSRRSAAEPITPGRSPPGMSSGRSLGAPVARITAS